MRFMVISTIAGSMVFEIPLTANVSQTKLRVSLEGETQSSSYGLLRKSVTSFALSLKFLMTALLVLKAALIRSTIARKCSTSFRSPSATSNPTAARCLARLRGRKYFRLSWFLSVKFCQKLTPTFAIDRADNSFLLNSSHPILAPARKLHPQTFLSL